MNLKNKQNMINYDVKYKLIKLIFILGALVLGLNGCSSDKDINPPAKLLEFKEQAKLQQVWSKGIGNGQGDLWNNLQIATDGNLIFAVSNNGKVYALDKASGKVKWYTKLKQKNISGGVGYGFGLVLVGTTNGDVVAIDAQNGNIRWQAKVMSEILSAPSVNSQIVVVQSQDDNLTAFNINDGSKLWQVDNQNAVLSLRGTSAPITTNLLVLAGLSSGKLIAVNAENGSIVWEQRIAIASGRTELERMIDIDGNLQLSGNSLYAVSFQGKASAFDLTSGNLLWSVDASSYVGLEEKLGTVIIIHADGTIESFDENSQSVVWQTKALSMRELSAPSIMEDYVLVGDYEGYLHVLSLEDGSMVARAKVGGSGVRAKILVVDDLIYVFTNNGKLVVYNLVVNQ